MVQFSYRKGVYMQVSAVSISTLKTVFNTKANNKAYENNAEANVNHLNSKSKNNKLDNNKKLYDSINEWKNFCHRQIEKGNFDVII